MKFAVWELVFLLVLITSNIGRAETNLFQTKVGNFGCTNLSVSAAICMLSKHSSVPVNSIIDDFKEPTVSINERESTLGDILGKILAELPKYKVILKTGTILVLPEGFEKDETVGLNKVLNKFEVTYTSIVASQGNKIFRCEFLDKQAPSLNVALTKLFLNEKPKYSSFPTVRTFQEVTLLDVLVTISNETKISWSCSRITPHLVHEINMEHAKYGYPPAWPDEKARCYQLYWGIEGYHGEIIPSEPTEKQLKEIKEFWDAQAAIKRGIKNAANSPIAVEMSMKAKEVPIGGKIIVKCKVSNSSSEKMIIPNPFRNIKNHAFFEAKRIFSAKGTYAEFDIQILPQPNEPEKLTLQPHETYEHVVNITNSKMVLDELHSDVDFKGERTQKFGPGKYTLRGALFYKDQTGKEYYIFASGLLEFEIKATGN